MKLLSKLLIYFFLLVYSPLKAQNVTLTGTIYDYATYYVSSFDPQTGASDFQLFRYTLSSDSYPVWVKISFRATMVSPALGINSETAILDLYTSPFVIENDKIPRSDYGNEYTLSYWMYVNDWEFKNKLPKSMKSF